MREEDENKLKPKIWMCSINTNVKKINVSISFLK